MQGYISARTRRTPRDKKYRRLSALLTLTAPVSSAGPIMVFGAAPPSRRLIAGYRRKEKSPLAAVPRQMNRGTPRRREGDPPS